jgi:hypothetical protein
MLRSLINGVEFYIARQTRQEFRDWFLREGVVEGPAGRFPGDVAQLCNIRERGWL